MTIPVLKWAGGKRQLLDDLYDRFPAEYNSYHEPFFGGGALFFDLEPSNGTINDTNTRLINFYEHVRDNPRELIRKLQQFDGPETPANPDQPFNETNRKGREIKNYYYQQRERFNNRVHGDEFDSLEEAALLLYLNRTCFNGLYRENASGDFNVPIGGYVNPDWVRSDEIKQASKVLSNTEILNKNWTYILEKANHGDLVYLDPPYKPMSATEYFNDYSAEGFGKEDQEELCEKAYKLTEKGVHVIVSNSGVTYGMYEDAGFDVGVVGATRSINSDGENRDEVDEIIATNIPEDKRGDFGQQSLVDFNA